MVGVLTVKTETGPLTRSKGDSREATLTEEGVPAEPTGFRGTEAGRGTSQPSRKCHGLSGPLLPETALTGSGRSWERQPRGLRKTRSEAPVVEGRNHPATGDTQLGQENTPVRSQGAAGAGEK